MNIYIHERKKMKIYKNFKESNNVTVYNGDCIKLLKRLPDEAVDLIITSPPYCMGKAYEDPHNDIETFKTEEMRIYSSSYELMSEMGRETNDNRSNREI